MISDRRLVFLLKRGLFRFFETVVPEYLNNHPEYKQKLKKAFVETALSEIKEDVMEQEKILLYGDGSEPKEPLGIIHFFNKGA